MKRTLTMEQVIEQISQALRLSPGDRVAFVYNALIEGRIRCVGYGLFEEEEDT